MKRYLFIALCLVSLACGAFEQNTIRYAVFRAPPYMIFGDSSDAEDISGIDVDIVRELAKRMNLNIRFIKCPWVRCLRLMETGGADLLSGAHKKPDREEYMQYLDSAYLNKLPIAFYTRKGSGISIANYSDLHRLRTPIGVLQGASYFPQFDNDASLRKAVVSLQSELFPMLLKERFDAVIGYVPSENYRLITEGYEGKVEKSKFEYSEPMNIYMAISKKSTLARRYDELNATNNLLIAEGVIERIRSAYYRKYSPK